MGQKQRQPIIIKLLKSVLIEGHNLKQAFGRYLYLAPAEEIAFIQEVVYGTLRYYKTLDYWLKQYLTSPINSRDIYLLLLSAFYQLAYTHVPSYAVVNDSVTLVHTWRQERYKKLVNALLRRFLREKPFLYPLLSKAKEVHYNLPLWWIKRLEKDYPNSYLSILEAYQHRPPLTLRVNQRKINPLDYLSILERQSIAVAMHEGITIQLLKPMAVEEIPYFFEGYVTLQDWGAQQAAKLLNVNQNAYVLDACAAPGGKTTHLLEWADCELVALDINAQRLQKLEANLKRLQLSATIHCANAATPEEWWDARPFDYILADVPCTASGVVKRNPDIRWLRKPNDPINLAKQQIQLLDSLWYCLKNTGKMLLSTCSIFAEENQHQLQKFLTRNSDAILLKEHQILPDIHTDGFYYALLLKQVK
ncbi:MAG: 16S rRNA (cytosine(967)-C(5))-methyltransferase RsmB [Neisseriaceae bacterium]